MVSGSPEGRSFTLEQSSPDVTGDAKRTESLQRLWGTVRRVTMGFRKQSHHMAGTYGLSSPQLIVFMVVSAGGPMTMGQIGERSELPTSSLTALVDRLGELGLMVREQHPSDRRALQVRLSGAGIALAERIALDTLQATAAIAGGLDDAEVEQVDRLLGRLLDGFDAYANRTHTPDDQPGTPADARTEGEDRTSLGVDGIT